MNDYQVKPGHRVKLDDWDPDDTGTYSDAESARSTLDKDVGKLARLQERLYGEGRRALLVVLQGMDTAGKDGTIKHVFTGVNPIGCQVTSFKQPSSEELAHDFLWRVHRATPRRGQIGIFNRSQYEDVLVVRVEQLVPRSEWSQRYDRINEFERLLTQEDTVVVKFFLHISKREQRRRLDERLADPDKRWKYDAGDVSARKKWSAYQAAYADALTLCSTKWAPWHIVPANHKWYRNLVVASTLVRALEKIDPSPRRSNNSPQE
jgi:PPK2 family polyphosphate:nucleotide phosphotransferase